MVTQHIRCRNLRDSKLKRLKRSLAVSISLLCVRSVSQTTGTNQPGEVSKSHLHSSILVCIQVKTGSRTPESGTDSRAEPGKVKESCHVWCAPLQVLHYPMNYIPVRDSTLYALQV